MFVLIPLASAALYGIAPLVYGKYVKKIGALWASLTSSIPPFLFAMFARGYLGVEPSDVLVIVLASMFGGFVGTLGYMRSIEVLGPELAVVLTSAYMFYVPLIASLAEIEVVNVAVVIGGLLVFLGIYTLYRSPNKPNVSGLVLTQITAVSWSISTNLLAMALKSTSILGALFVRSAAVLFFFTALVLALRPPRPKMQDVVYFAPLSTLDGLIALYLFLKSLELAGPSLTAVIVSTYPAYSVLVKILRGAGVHELIGLALVILGVFAASVGSVG